MSRTVPVRNKFAREILKYYEGFLYDICENAPSRGWNLNDLERELRRHSRDLLDMGYSSSRFLESLLDPKDRYPIYPVLRSNQDRKADFDFHGFGSRGFLEFDEAVALVAPCPEEDEAWAQATSLLDRLYRLLAHKAYHRNLDDFSVIKLLKSKGSQKLADLIPKSLEETSKASQTEALQASAPSTGLPTTSDCGADQNNSNTGTEQISVVNATVSNQAPQPSPVESPPARDCLPVDEAKKRPAPSDVYPDPVAKRHKACNQSHEDLLEGFIVVRKESFKLLQSSGELLKQQMELAKKRAFDDDQKEDINIMMKQLDIMMGLATDQKPEETST
ncbi:hypothetical protein B0I35DRAFT_504978 [Stachybotrys elegans]|uniref:Uncharacterized protein n=1 Tax=Stachybotrys elegans TaxID=80388 RepID=A0A8K0SPJ4_9HYPO|nr:hypothetical protein B0I35DRAFT_504978 [Stachybotrys elegans]